jgi:TRAP-type C4-dicarboxylate transport system substrate-binding protein
LVTERTEGKIRFEHFPNESLVGGRDALPSLASGMIDMYMVGSTYVSGTIPILTALELPQIGGRGIEDFTPWSNKFLGEIFQEYLQPAFRAAGVELVGPISGGGGTEMVFVRPVRSAADYAGRKIRTVGGVTDKILNALNATPVFISSADVYLGLQTGVVDGSQTTAATIKSNKLYELCPYWVEPTLGGGISTTFLLMSPGKWNMLSESQKAIFTRAVFDTLEYTAEYNPSIVIKEREEVRPFFREVIRLPPEEIAKINAVSIDPIWTEVYANADPKTRELIDLRRIRELE